MKDTVCRSDKRTVAGEILSKIKACELTVFPESDPDTDQFLRLWRSRLLRLARNRRGHQRKKLRSPVAERAQAPSTLSSQLPHFLGA